MCSHGANTEGNRVLSLRDVCVDQLPCSWKGCVSYLDHLFHVEETNRWECVKRKERIRQSRKTSLYEEVRGCDVMITGSILDDMFVRLTESAEKTSGMKSKQVALSLVRVAGIRERKRQKENGEATRCEHYGGGSSNRVALDVAGSVVEQLARDDLDVDELEDWVVQEK
ncbi:hypothetical protein Tco_0679772 [Tanacetum coccineum]|uniref:Uncharacterized protein n=1 Tax=Tanacetum coccineum TaxID=301880 RepID=A0ABQ4XJT2_9ASTR